MTAGDTSQLGEDNEGLPHLIAICGPNGSGKSTAVAALQNASEFPQIYINADDIARTELANIPDLNTRNIQAAELAEARRKEAIEKGVSFAFESVMSTPGKLAILAEAKEKGFTVDLIFVTTDNADINVERVRNRAAMGGHNVDEAKIRERYQRAMELLPSATEISHSADIFDNSAFSTGSMYVAKKRDGRLEVLNTPDRPAWVIEGLVKPWAERTQSREQMESLAQETGLNVAPADIRHGKVHVGKVVGESSHHVLQQVGANKAVLHDKTLMPPVKIELQKSMTIPYRYHQGGKHMPLDQTPDRSKGIQR